MKSINIQVDTQKMSMKLRTIADHFNSLADQLEIIDNKQQCSECGSYNTFTLREEGKVIQIECDACDFITKEI